MQQFMIIALAHFLALLSPGPDFFLVARNAISSGWRIASGACLGIALANGAFIVIAFTGLSVLQQGSLLFSALQLVGASYLLYIGVLFLRHAGQTSLGTVSRQPAGAWLVAQFGHGLLVWHPQPQERAVLCQPGQHGRQRQPRLENGLRAMDVQHRPALGLAGRRGHRQPAGTAALRPQPGVAGAGLGVMLVMLAGALLLHLARG